MREKLIELLYKEVRCPGTVASCGECPYRSNETPCDEYAATADMLIANGVVIPVRCKDCAYWMKDVAGCTDFVGRCAYANYMIGATGYCLYGERKEKGDGRT